MALKEGAGATFWLAELLDVGAYQVHLEIMRALGGSVPSLRAQNDGIKDFFGLRSMRAAGAGMLMGPMVGDSA